MLEVNLPETSRAHCIAAIVSSSSSSIISNVVAGMTMTATYIIDSSKTSIAVLAQARRSGEENLVEWWASATMTPTSRGKAKVSVVGPFEATEEPIREGKLSLDEWPMEPCGGTRIGQF